MKKRPTYFPCLEFASVIKVVMKTTGFFYFEKMAINKTNIIIIQKIRQKEKYRYRKFEMEIRKKTFPPTIKRKKTTSSTNYSKLCQYRIKVKSNL